MGEACASDSGALALRPVDAETQYHLSMLEHPRSATCRQAGCGVNGAGKAPNLGWRAPPDGNGPNGGANLPRARRCCSAPNRDSAICRISAAMPDWPPLGVARDRRGAIAADPLAAKFRRRGAGRCLADAAGRAGSPRAAGRFGPAAVRRKSGGGGNVDAAWRAGMPDNKKGPATSLPPAPFVARKTTPLRRQ
jgi:hypothetical protein